MTEALSWWDISPDGVNQVLGQTASVAAEFDTQMVALGTNVAGAMGEVSSQIVGEAVNGFLEARMPDIEFVFSRTGACLNAAAAATSHYVSGDLEMAANAQAAATAAPDPTPHLPGTHGRGVPLSDDRGRGGRRLDGGGHDD